MCGRFVLWSAISVLEEFFELGKIDIRIIPRHNIAPSQEIVVVPNRPERSIELHRWGLIPSWAKDASIGNKLINARAETLAEKPSFRDAFRNRRCLIPADGFYEWMAEGTSKTPMHIRLKSKRPFAFAGLWETWKSPDGKAVASAAIITTRPNELMAPIHGRMPVILRREDYATWLRPDPMEPGDLAGLLEPYPEGEMEAFPVSKRVNSPRNDGPDCIAPA